MKTIIMATILAALTPMALFAGTDSGDCREKNQISRPASANLTVTKREVAEASDGNAAGAVNNTADSN